MLHLKSVIQLFYMQLNEIKLWFDMQLSPTLAKWMGTDLGIKAVSSYDLFINNEKDETIFLSAKSEGNIIILSKDSDFPHILNRLFPPPKLIWLRMGELPKQPNENYSYQHFIEGH